ncbi:Zn-dependent hydrolase [Thioclava indica]|uniref:Peptidase M20 dimerisation domain-containing protein n=1 Tax=Thioclava indica TaxID=1353528 RepID=A0A074JGV3_9RHOB|nr:Zn-dependent hydrolase [Thioclava indica]KEO55100.1 hypothetical protein DT23_17960 [Thioclava indica]
MTIPTNMLLDEARLWSELMALAEITDPDRPHTRRSFSKRFIEGRAYLTAAFKGAGLSVHVDENGNLVGRLEGTDPDLGTLVIGSHSDTVPDGGRFDGVAGVVAGLEVARALKQSGIRLRHSLEIIDCLAEEMSEYGLSCVGSRGLVGELAPEMLDYRGPKGETLAQAIERVGGQSASITQTPRRDITAYLELHIEQGRVLESKGLDVGVVTNVVGITRIEIDVTGQSDHAGTTPMDMRRDALSLAAELALEIERLAREIAARGAGYFVATTGEFEIMPNAANVVPGQVRMVLDVRTDVVTLKDDFVAGLELAAQRLGSAREASIEEIRVLSDSAATLFDAALIEQLQRATDHLGLSAIQMPSGAGHDAVFFSRIAPAAMVFVPCRDGRSHCPEEWSEPHQITAGAAVLLETIFRVDGLSQTPTENAPE